MEEKKIIMFFLDLEGTIIDEESGEMQKDKIESLLESLNRLEQMTGSIVNMHIVSPVFIHDMERVMDQLDRIIANYNNKNQTRLKDIQGAVAYPETNYISTNDLYDKIFPMNISRGEDFDRYGKLDYVKKWIEAMENKIDFTIYGGNGLNDTSAMEYIKRNKKGFAICPKNSYDKVKNIADYVSDKDESEGIKDGIDFINEQIERRKQKNKEQGEEIGID